MALRLSDHCELYLGDVARRCTPATERKYRCLLGYFLDKYETLEIEDITQDHCEEFLNRWSKSSKATMALHTTIITRFFEYSRDRGAIVINPAEKIKRPRLPRPEDREVTIISTEDVRKMFHACESWGDEICLGLLAYTGSRRNAISQLRWKDIDLTGDEDSPYGWIRFREKGRKVIEKPIDGKLRAILDRAPFHLPDDYVAPNYKPKLVRRAERKNDIIYRRVKNIAKRANVETHVHAIRAAFAVLFLEQRRGDTVQLKEWLGHERLDTTQNYVRGLNRRKALARSMGFDWGIALNEEASSGYSSERIVPEPQASTDIVSSVGNSSVVIQSEASSLSALSEGEHSTGGGSSLRSGAANLGSLSESASRHESHGLRRDRSKPLPPKPSEAHTGFEPVLLLYALCMQAWQKEDTLDDSECHAILPADIVPVTRGHDSKGDA